MGIYFGAMRPRPMTAWYRSNEFQPTMGISGVAEGVWTVTTDWPFCSRGFDMPSLINADGGHRR